MSLPDVQPALRRAAGVLIASVLLSGSLATVAPSAAIAARSHGPRANLVVLEKELMCVTCKIPLYAAISVQASDERAYIQSLISKGETSSEVKRALVSQYGPTVLGMPPAHGFNLFAYLIPLAVVLFLIGVLATLLPAWRRHARAQASQPRSPLTDLSPADTARLDADLARFD